MQGSLVLYNLNYRIDSLEGSFKIQWLNCFIKPFDFRRERIPDGYDPSQMKQDFII